jgi:hypothetical protein
MPGIFDHNDNSQDADEARANLEQRVKESIEGIFGDTPFTPAGAHILSDVVIICGWGSLAMNILPTVFRAGSMHGTEGLIDYAYKTQEASILDLVRRSNDVDE